MKRNLLLSLLSLLCFGGAFAQEENNPYERHVLVEEFTTENCPNCPRGATIMAEIMADNEINDRVIPVTHHSGYYEDWLTTDADRQYLWFFNENYTYAPAIMYDRYPFFNTDSGYETPVSSIHTTSDVKKYIKKRLKAKSHLRLDISGEFDNQTTATIRVNGERSKVFTELEPRITVYVLENRVKAKSQAGAGSGYKHSHVMRTYNQIWGDLINWNGDTFEYECKIEINPEWNKDNLEIVAFVSTLDPEDQAACIVENARAVSFNDFTGIEDIQADSSVVATEYFTIGGVKTDALCHGMYIEKKTFADGGCEIRKITR